MEQVDKPESEEERWRTEVFLGNTMPEFTTRAVVAGLLLGVLIMAENVYMGLKTGITEAGSILSAILCFAFFRSIRSNLSILENNTAQTLSSAAGSIGIIVSVVPALYLVGFPLHWWQMLIWVMLVGFLGLFFAIPLRRQLIIHEHLTFPTGAACATTIKAMHAHGGEAIRKAKVLGLAGLAGGIITWFRDAVPVLIPTTTNLPGTLGGYALGELSLGLYWSPLVLGVGLMIGVRIGASLLIGAIAGWGGIGPALASSHVIEKIGHTEISHWTMWPAIALMVASGFTSLALKGGMIARSLKSMRNVSYDRNNLIEFPFHLWVAGIGITIVLLLIFMNIILQVPIWMGIVGIVMSFVFATVAIRGYGETDINPVGTMGHANQIVAGMVNPGHTVSNLACGGVTAGCADVSADLMQVLKTGYLIGASPRRQITAQFIGVAVGALTAVAVFLLLSKTYGIGTENMPAPGALPWSGMANLLSQGISALPAYSGPAVLVGAVLGIILALFEKTRFGKYTPSPFGLGIGLVVPGFISISIFLASLLGMLVEKKAPRWSEKYLMSVASGSIAGEAITGVLISILTVFAILG